jgi:glutamate carboxypeptidase
MPPAIPIPGQTEIEVFRSLLLLARAAEPRLIARTRTLVEMESPSHDKASVDRVAACVSEWCREATADIALHRHRNFGDSLEARFGPSSDSRKPILLLGHLDTVWDIGTLASMPWHEDAEEISGPGILDMKAGVVIALTAL